MKTGFYLATIQWRSTVKILRKYSIHILTILLVIVLSITIYTYQFNRHSINQWQLIMNHAVSAPDHQETPFFMVFFRMNQNLTDDEIKSMYNTIKNISHQEELTIFTTSISNATYRTQLQQAFLQTYPGSDVARLLPLLNQNVIDFSSATDLYYSTDFTDPHAYNYIEFLNPLYNTDSFDLITVQQMSAFIHPDSHHLLDNISFNFWSEDGRRMEDVFHTLLGNYGTIDFGRGDWIASGFDFREEADLFLIVILLFILIALLTISIVIRKTPEIAIRKSKGNKVHYIFLQLFCKFTLIQVTAYGVTQVLLSTFISGAFRPTSRDFYITLFYWLSFFFAFILILSIGIMLCIILIKYGWMKKNVKSNRLLPILLVLKLVFIVMALPNLVDMVHENSDLFLARRIIHEKMEQVEHLYSVQWVRQDAFGDGDWRGGISAIGHTFNILSEHNLYYVDITSLFFSERFEFSNMQHPFAIVNRTVIYESHIYDTSGTVVDFNYIPPEQHVFLVPYNYDVNLNDYLFINDALVILVEETPRLYTLLPDCFLPIYIDNPIIAVIGAYTEGEMFPINMLSNPFMHFSLYSAQEREELSSRLLEAGLSEIVQFNNFHADLQRNYVLVSSILNSMLLKIALYLIIIVLFSFIVASIYIKSKIRYLSVLYMKGFGFWERYGEILSIIGLTNVISMLLLILISNHSKLILLLIMLLITIFETSSLMLYISMRQKKDISSYLKWM